MYGVSPAYFVSRFGDGFSCDDVARALPDLAAAGFDAVQLEVFHRARLDDWSGGGARRIRTAADASGLATSQFVCHWLMGAFETPWALAADDGLDELDIALDALAAFPDCRLVTIVLPPFRPTDPAELTAAAHAAARARLVDKLARMLDRVEGTGRRMALELLPGSLVGGVAGFLRLAEEMAAPSLGYNFDTGFVWSAREWPPLVPARLGARILGTHLKDNAQDDGALAPGQGTLPWRETLGALAAAGYAGSYDLEFRCAPQDAHRAYVDALATLKRLMRTAPAHAA